MKKILLLFVLAGLVFSTNACKKKECPAPPKPEVWGVGTWNASKVVDSNGQEMDSSDPAVACDLTDVMVLNENHNGTSWKLPYYDNNSNTCQAYNLSVSSWAENIHTKKLYVTVTYQGNDFDFAFKYVDENNMYYDATYDYYYEKQQ